MFFLFQKRTGRDKTLRVLQRHPGESDGHGIPLWRQCRSIKKGLFTPASSPFNCIISLFGIFFVLLQPSKPSSMISKNKIKLIRSLEYKKHRKAEGLFIAEGPKIVNDLLEAGFSMHTVIGTKTYLAKTRCHADEIIEVDDNELRKVSFMQHPQEVLGIFQTNKREKSTIPDNESLSLALDGIQDPGNLGTIIRIADWFGIENMFCSTDTVDAFNPKVIQATMGSIARVNIAYTDLGQLIDALPKDVPVYGTFLDGRNIYNEKLTKGGLIVMGSEGNGISEEIRKRINYRLFIPDYPNGQAMAESLNVAIATAITCNEFRRRLSIRL